MSSFFPSKILISVERRKYSGSSKILPYVHVQCVCVHFDSYMAKTNTSVIINDNASIEKHKSRDGTTSWKLFFGRNVVISLSVRHLEYQFLRFCLRFLYVEQHVESCCNDRNDSAYLSATNHNTRTEQKEKRKITPPPR